MIETPAYLRNAKYVGEIPPAPGTHEMRSWVERSVLGLLVVVLMGLLSGCPPPEPPTPTPTPSPATNYHPELRLTTQGGAFVFADGHAPFEFRKVIYCCKPDCEGSETSGWPGLSECAIRHAASQGRATMLHWRVGPFRACNEPEWAVTGGGAYLEDAQGKADLTQWNEAYWTALKNRIRMANDLGIVVEVSINDGWGVKTVKWSSGGTACYHPWHNAGNVQGENHLATAWRGSLDATHRAYVQKVVKETCKWGGVLYEDGTEADQVPGAKIQWSLEMLAIVREVEAEEGCAAHLYGSNFKADPVFPYLRQNRIQYLNAHDTQPTDAKTFWGTDPIRPYVSDESNPTPPMAPEAVAAFWQYANAHGTYWSAWRHDMDTNPWNAALSLIAQGGKPGWEDGCPYEVRTMDLISCRRHSNNMFDCTGKAGGQPIRPEGDITRALCELSAAGLGPGDRVSYSVVNASSPIGVNQRPNPWQFVLTGSAGAHGTLRCTLPRAPNVDLCRGPVVTVQ